MRRQDEFLPALIAGERPFAGVIAQVTFDIRGPFESLPALKAREWPGFGSLSSVLVNVL